MSAGKKQTPKPQAGRVKKGRRDDKPATAGRRKALRVKAASRAAEELEQLAGSPQW